MASIAKRPNGQWRARYRDDAGQEHARHFGRKVDAQRWLDGQTAALVTGTHVSPRTARMTVAEWSETWLQGYAARRPTTAKNARDHMRLIVAEFGSMPLSAVRPSQVKTWTAKLAAEGRSASYVHRVHGRLAQLFADAVHDGLIPRSPCSRRTSPKAGQQRPYVATTEQVWALYEALPEHLRPAILLGAFAGLRVGEACGLRVGDVDYMRGIVHPTVQYPAEPLKTEMSRTPVPIPQELALMLSAHVGAVVRLGHDALLTNTVAGQLSPESLDAAIRAVRGKVDGLPAGFRFHDLRHYFASLLIANKADVKVVQARLRHASAKTTLDTYSHLWPDADDSTRAAVAAVFVARADNLRTRGGGES